ncbi:class II aldolase/adducin family protein [Moorella sp. ACPs]|uniref:class II aldolase/adducin family protein n=1 Tax=Neomoorella carbonis TaxID=3062783 RepID=UPI0032506573
MLAQLREELIAVCHEVYRRGFSSGSGGNISVRIPDSNYVLIKRSGCSLGRVRAVDCILIDMDGNLVEGRGKPSKEINLHLGIYRCRPEVGAVIHAHPPYAIAFANTYGSLPLVTVSARAYLKQVPNISFAPPGSAELARLVIEQYQGTRINTITMVEHGAVTAGKDLQEAYDLMDYLEDNAKVALAMLQIKALGGYL